MVDVRYFRKDAEPFEKANWGTKRRIMRSFKISEISGVTVPAQEGARFILSKSLDQPATPEAFAKVSFRAALDARMIERKFCDIFYAAFEGQYAAQEAFREALKDRFNDSEQVAREYVDEIAAMALRVVDETRGLAKSEITNTRAIDDAVIAAVKAAVTGTEKETPMYKTLAELIAAIKAFNAGDATIKKAEIQKSAIDLAAVDQLTGDLALSQPDPDLAKLKAEVALLKMSANERKYYDGLDEKDKASFMAMDSDKRAAAMAKSNEVDPVIYTTKAGVEIRKSDGAVSATLAKQLDEQSVELTKLRGENADAVFVKQAETEFAYLPQPATVALLKAAATMSDEDRKKILEAQRAANKALEPRFSRLGKTTGETQKSSGADPADQLDAMAKAYASQHKVDFIKAYSAVIATPEGRTLYAETVTN